MYHLEMCEGSHFIAAPASLLEDRKERCKIGIEDCRGYLTL